MTCKDVRDLIDAYADGELDLVRSLEIEEHLQDCPACSQVYRNLRTLKGSLAGSALYYSAPAGLQASVQAAVRKSSGAEQRVVRPPLWAWAAVAAALVVAVLAAWGVARLLSSSSGSTSLEQEVVASHVRSLMPGHLTDVASTDKHTVKPWFDGKLDFSPSVVDLSEQGFPLIGGRLDYLDGRPVAALVYGRNKHFINLFVWPSSDPSGTSASALQGYNVIHWTKGGMTYWAVSDVTPGDLQAFVQIVQQQTGTSP
jgi:anti-sigma factor RsiW